LPFWVGAHTLERQRSVVESAEATRVFVTGATGFVGSHLVEALAGRGIAVRALVRRTSDTTALHRPGIERITGGLDDPDVLARGVDGVDVVYHLAALTHARSEAEYHRVNASGTERLIAAIRAAQRPPRRVVLLSSLAAAGPARGDRPVDRGDAPSPLTAYGRSKLAAERICLDAQGSVEVVVLRAPAVYGPRDRELLRFFRMAARGVVPIPAGPRRLIQMVHVGDLAEALALAGEARGATGIYHVAEPRAYDWGEVVEWIGRAVGRRPKVVKIPGGIVAAAAAINERAASLLGRSTMFNRDKVRELLAPGWLCETEALRREYGFTPRIPLPEGLAQTAAWYRARGWL